MRERVILVIVFALCSLWSFSQSRLGVSAGVVGNLGSSVRRIGVFVGGFAANYGVMVNVRSALFYNTCSWGNRQSSPEIQIGTGIVLGIPAKDLGTIRQWDVASSGGYHAWAISFARNWYFDRLGTSQRSGTIGLQFKNVYILTENDIFGHHRTDAYRTAAAAIQYRKNDYFAGVKLLLWTGDSFHPKSQKYENTNYPARFGYKDLSETLWGRNSLGIFAFEVGYALQYRQFARGAIGVDAEQVRHIFQNKFVHDAYFVPPHWIKHKDYHYPMLDINGCPVVDSSQHVRPVKFFINGSMNENLFY